MIKLSIIVPIYGVEPYLRKCVVSLLAQDLPSSEYEIILVDDESPDTCPQICDEYAAAHENIRVIHRENGGLSAARNSGIEIAKGEYIMFVDSDDYIEPDVLGGLMEQVEREQLDVLRYDFRNVNERYEEFQPNKYPHPYDRENNVVDGVAYLNSRMSYGCYAWQWIVRRALLIDDRYIDDRCIFTEGIHFEDVDWMPRMMLRAKRVNSTQTIVYNYLWREGSITLTQGNKAKIVKNIEDRIYVINELSMLYATHPDCKWLNRMRGMMVAGVLSSIANELYDERKKYIDSLRKMKVFPLAIADQGKTYRRWAKLINIVGPNIFCVLKYYL